MYLIWLQYLDRFFGSWFASASLIQLFPHYLQSAASFLKSRETTLRCKKRTRLVRLFIQNTTIQKLLAKINKHSWRMYTHTCISIWPKHCLFKTSATNHIYLWPKLTSQSCTLYAILRAESKRLFLRCTCSSDSHSRPPHSCILHNPLRLRWWAANVLN